MNLHGARVLVTRPRAQAEAFVAALQAEGAVPIVLPVIEIQPVADPTRLDAALERLTEYDWVIFTSANGVAAAWERLAVLGKTGLPGKVRLAAIGPLTAAALAAHGRAPDFVPPEFIAEAILPGLGELANRKMLLLRADLARPALAEAIRVAGGRADEITVYQTRPAEPDWQALAALQGRVDVVTFTSSSTVHNFAALMRAVGLDPAALPGKPRLACIGPITAEAARQQGLAVDIVAQVYTTDGLLQAIKDWDG